VPASTDSSSGMIPDRWVGRWNAQNAVIWNSLGAFVELRDIEAFVVLSEELHFGRAARRLFYTTSQLSRRVKHLEGELGVSLFIRSSRSVELSAAGESLLCRATALLEMASRLKADAGEYAPGGRKSLRVVYGPGVGRVAVAFVKALSREESPIEVDLDPCPTSPEVVELVLSGKATAGIAMATHDALVAVPLVLPQPLFVVVRADDEFAARDVASPGDLDTRPIVVMERARSPEPYDDIIGQFSRVGSRPVFLSRRVASDVHMFELVEAGQGWAIVRQPSNLPRDLKAVPLSGIVGTRTYLLFRPDQPRPVQERFRQVADAFGGDQVAENRG